MIETKNVNKDSPIVSLSFKDLKKKLEETTHNIFALSYVKY